MKNKNQIETTNINPLYIDKNGNLTEFGTLALTLLGIEIARKFLN